MFVEAHIFSRDKSLHEGRRQFAIVRKDTVGAAVAPGSQLLPISREDLSGKLIDGVLQLLDVRHVANGACKYADEYDANSKDDDNGKDKKSEYAAPTFRVELKGPFEFAIVFEENLPSLAKQYAVMDMKGQVLSVGELSSNDTRVKVPTSGSYVIKVGLGYKQVNVK